MDRNSKNNNPNRKRRLRFRHIFLVVCAAFAFSAAVYGISRVLPQRPAASVQSSRISSSAEAGMASSAVSKVSSAPVSSEMSSPARVSITILGAGDNLIHDVIYEQAKARTGGKGYDFGPVYARIAPQIKAADIAVYNQETILADKIAPPSGYPLFNSPTDLGDEMANIGFDVINHGNNHILDLGEKGIKATLDYWAKKPVAVVGAYHDDADLENIRIVEVKGIKTAHIGITEMTNGLYLPKNSKYRLIYASNTPLIERLIKKAKSMADVVVISVHWGDEDTFHLSDKQTQLAQNMINWGADIIFGNHAHVLQKLTVLTRPDGTRCPVIYALGNLVSAQQRGENMIGGLLTVTMTKNFETGKTSFTGMKLTPVITQYGPHCTNITIYPIRDYTDALAQAHGVRRYTPEFNRHFINYVIDQTIPKEYLDES